MNIQPMDTDLSQEDLGQYQLPPELKHLEPYRSYAKPIKEDVWGFFIPQFKNDGTKNMDWYNFRSETIGASAVAMLVGLSEYGDPVELFHEKLGFKMPFTDSSFTYFGLLLEDKIAFSWRYYDGTEDGYVANKFAGKVIRENAEIPCYAINVNYPWISASLDYLVPGGQVSPFTGEKINFDFPLEIKNISPFAAEKYETGLPSTYVAQVNEQMLVTGCTYAEIAFLTSGCIFKTMPFDMDLALCQKIILETRALWDRVEEARAIIKVHEDTLVGLESPEEINELIETTQNQIHQLEPEPTGNKAFLEFYKAKYKVSRVDTARAGDEDEWDLAVSYKKISAEIKRLTKEKDVIKHKIFSYSVMDEEVSFMGGDNGRVVNRRPDVGKSYFGVNIKNWEDDK